MRTTKLWYDPKKFINIGGAIYSRKAGLGWMDIKIVGYDINTERHLKIIDSFGETKRIELDNDQLKLRERYQRSKQ